MELYTPETLVQIVESPYRTHEVACPYYGYRRFVSPLLLSTSSKLYEIYLSTHGISFSTNCIHCHVNHPATRFCLPRDFLAFDMDFLLDVLEKSPRLAISTTMFFRVLRICGYLMVNTRIIVDLIQLYVPFYLHYDASFVEQLLHTLTVNGYTPLANQLRSISLRDSS